jgi:hypothetical protein
LQIFFEGAAKGKEMEIDNGLVQMKTNHPWEPRKCIPQAPLASKYVINMPKIEEHKKYMRDYVLVGKFLGLWPYEHELIKWIHQWCNPKGNYNLQLGSKGFFTIIFITWRTAIA